MAVKRFLFIRHGKTQSNLERRYPEDPDEPLCADGAQEAGVLARAERLPDIGLLITGTALRCRQTAEILFSGVKPVIFPLTEINFGLFKGKRADDLSGDNDYIQWLGTGCMGDIPGGESVSAFKERCCKVFLQISEMFDVETAAMVVHGGNIMAIMEYFAIPKRDFFEYHIPNCGFILCRFENGALYDER